MDLQRPFEAEATLASGEMPKSRQLYNRVHQSRWILPLIDQPMEACAYTLAYAGQVPGSLSQDAPVDYLQPILEGMYAGPVRYAIATPHQVDSGQNVASNIAAGAGLLEIS